MIRVATPPTGPGKAQPPGPRPARTRIAVAGIAMLAAAIITVLLVLFHQPTQGDFHG